MCFPGRADRQANSLDVEIYRRLQTPTTQDPHLVATTPLARLVRHHRLTAHQYRTPP